MESRNQASLEEYSRSFVSFVSKNVSSNAVNVASGNWQRLPGVLAVPFCDLKLWKRNWEIYRGNIPGRDPCCTEEELQTWMDKEGCELKEGGLYCAPKESKPKEDKSKDKDKDKDKDKRGKIDKDPKPKEKPKGKPPKPKPNDDKKGGGAPFG
jgi:hypothetical protein